MAIKQDRIARATLKAGNDPTGKEGFENAMQTRRNIIADLNNRIDDWNHKHCPQCDTSLEGCEPAILTVEELVYFEDHSSLLADGQDSEKSESFRFDARDPQPEFSPRGSSEMMFSMSP